MKAEPRSASPEETRQRILAATRELFSRKGRRGTTTREIAERAGVNEATLFRQFGNKDALIMACAQRFCGAVELQSLITELPGTLDEDLCAIARALVDRIESVRDLIVMSLAEEDEQFGVADQAWRAPHAIHEVIVEYMAHRVRTGELHGDPIWLARFFMGMIFARVIGRKKFPVPVSGDPDEHTKFQVSIFLNGVRSK
ncbi:MAG: TetR/AcrR family transcriptional regulator [Candidatus Eremiobacteraeota bacterium]|nr:TetR/AcrR family transcriptional regulator [Candidatus Eremiobacteraeota bacterium]